MRTLTSGAITALSGAQVPLVMLVEMAFSPVLRVASSNVDIVWSGNTYIGAGPLGAVDAIKDSSGDASSLQFHVEQADWRIHHARRISRRGALPRRY